MPRFVLLLVLLLALGGPSAFAQSGPPETITFEDAVRIALRQSAAIERAELGAEAASDAVDLARSAFLPDLSVSVQPVRRYGLTFDQTTGSLQQQTSDALSGSVSTSLNLFNGFRDQAELARRRLEAQAGSLVLERTREDIAFAVAAQFLDVVLADEIARIRAEAVTAQRLQRERVEALVDGGVRPRADLLQQDALIAEAELVLIQAEGQAELARTQLIRTLRLDPFGAYTFVAPPLDEAETEPLPAELAMLTEAALDRRADVRARDLQIEAAEEGIRVARSGMLPRVNLFANVGSSFSSLARQPVPGTGIGLPITDAAGNPILVGGEPLTLPGSPTLEPVPFGNQFFTDNRTGTIGVSIQVPVFDRFLTRAQVRQARLAVENERLAREELRQDVAVEVRQGLVEYRTAEQRFAAATRQAEAAEAALDAEQSRYDLGASTLTELAQAQTRLVEAESVRAQALAQLVFQRRRLAYTAGLLDLDTTLFD